MPLRLHAARHMPAWIYFVFTWATVAQGQAPSLVDSVDSPRPGDRLDPTITRSRAIEIDGIIGAPADGRYDSVAGLAKAVEAGHNVAPAAVDARLLTPHHPERLLIRFKPGRSRAAKSAVHRAVAGAEVLKSYRIVRDLTLVKVPPARLAHALKLYAADPNVLYAEPDIEVHIVATPNDPDFGLLWGMRNTGQTVDGDPGTPGADIRATYAWDQWTGDPDFRIAVIDTGVNYNHPDLAANIWTNPGEIPDNGVDDDGNGWVDDVHGYDFLNEDGDPMDDHYHGSHVAGTIGAMANNNEGVVGVNWQCKIVALKFLGSTGSGPISAAVDAMQYIMDNNIPVSNNSWGWAGVFGGFSQALYDAIQAAQQVDHIFVAAAGNFFFGLDDDASPHYPANFDLPNIIAVSATNNDDELGYFSNYGLTSVDVGAPGVNIYSTMLGTNYGFLNGTSMASPHVAGVVGLVASQNPSWSWQQVRDWIFLTARPIDALAGKTVTGGVVNAAAAVGDCNLNGAPDVQEISSGTSDDCNSNDYPDECESDCNSNDVADSCDIGTGSSNDCNANDIPDDCEPDCNGNSIQDDCDISLGLSDDCNENGIPDDCEAGWNQDCNGNSIADLCDIYDGTNRDCNDNSIPDECDIAWGADEDCTSNGVPDGCERDCNSNGAADSCDIADGISVDSNGDGLPDECRLGVRFAPIEATGAHTIVGQDIFLENGGQRVTFDVYLSGWDLDLDDDPLLDLYQFAVDTQVFYGAVGSNLNFAKIPCTADDDCFHSGFQNSLCQTDGFCDIFSSLYVDESRPDFVFSGFRAISLASPIIYWVGSLIFDLGVGVADEGGEKYIGTVILDVSPEAEGIFPVRAVPGAGKTEIFAPDDQIPLPYPDIIPAWIILPSDCNENGIPDATDIANGTSVDCDGSHLPDECEPDCNGNGVADICDATDGTSEDCTGNGIPDECEPDCNSNGSPDSCDTLEGTSPDCTGNEIPDECEPDCNENGVADSCDLLDGTSTDINGNGVPDECDGPILYVDWAARGDNNGTNWEDALTDLQSALTVAEASLNTAVEVEEIWVATGTYRPTEVNEFIAIPRTVAFVITFKIALYGGFAGGESSRDERDIEANPTVLSGDLFGNDGPDFANNEENAHHVVVIGYVDASTILDGFIITGGNANPTNFFLKGGGGGLLDEVSSATIRNCTFVGNSADHSGGGASSRGRSTTYINCRFLGNRVVDGSGGGLTLSGTSGVPTVINCIFSGNFAGFSSGALYGGGYGTLVNSTFANNHTDGHGGAMYVKTAMPISNCVFWGNSGAGGTDESGQIDVLADAPDINHSIVQGWTGDMGGIGNSGEDPMLLDAVGADGIAGTPDDDLRLAFGSPAIDSGDGDAVPADITDLDGDGDTEEAVPVDIVWNPRFHDDPFTADSGAGSNPFVDRGAHEYGVDCNANGIPDDQDVVDGISDDCNANGHPDDCEPDCNTNGLADGCDIDAGTSDDCTANGIPDECEPDCNGNDTADSCDIYDEFSEDTDGNGVPDECEVPIVFVRADADGANTGLVWADAYTDLQETLARARDDERIEEIWVGAGAYTPTSPGGSRETSFELINGVALYGGFAGWETDVSQRNVEANATILSGEIDGDGNPSNNSYHVVYSSEVDGTAVLDGFMIANGNASGTFSDRLGVGGGLYNDGGSPTIANCTFRDNSGKYGGGMFNEWAGHPTIINCLFSQNHGGAGGGLYTYGDTTLINCRFLDNSGSNAGGFYNLGESTATNCLFSGNEATTRHGGGIYNNTNGILTLTNCTVVGNQAANLGGGICDEGISVTLNNCILWDNGDRDTDGTGVTAQIYADGDLPVIANFSCIQGWSGSLAGVGSTGEDPGLIDADGADDVFGTEDDDPRLAANSPCIDAGDNAAVPADAFDVDGDGDTTELIPVDADGTARFVDDPFTIDTGEGAPPIVDMGAYEYGDDCNENGVPDDQDITSGTSDDCTSNEIPDDCEPDCTGTGQADSCDIQAGVALDCNDNRIPDTCDIAEGRSDDCDNSNIPDECEPVEDCNGNGTKDVCDIDTGGSLDCNLTLVPDECELSENDCNSNAVPDDCELAGNDCNENTIPDECEPDCNENSTPDSCDIAAGTSEDCTGNTIPDECEPDCNVNGKSDICDLADETSQDINSDGIPDECALVPMRAPWPDDVRKNRYITINPNNEFANVALQVSLSSMRRCDGDMRRACEVSDDCPGVCTGDHDLQCSDGAICGSDGPCMPTAPCVEHRDVGNVVRYIDEPFANTCVPLDDCDGQWFANLVDVPVYRVWNEEALYITDCEITPAAEYEVRSTPDGTIFSDSLTVGTIAKPNLHYADCVGPVISGEYTPPDGFTNVTDIQAILSAQAAVENAPPTTWVDLHGGSERVCRAPDVTCIVPQQILNVGDLQTIKFGFLGQTYVETPGHENPGDCP